VIAAKPALKDKAYFQERLRQSKPPRKDVPKPHKSDSSSSSGQDDQRKEFLLQSKKKLNKDMESF
jgi:hypothetical protein